MTAQLAAHWATMTGDQRHRWVTVLRYLTSAIPADSPSVLVEGHDHGAALVADRLAATLRDAGRPCVRLTEATCNTHADARHGRAAGTVVIADGSRWRDHLPAEQWQLRVWVRGAATRTGNGNRGDGADIVVDLHDPTWPVIRHIDGWFAPTNAWYRTEAQAFFANRAATWDTRFGDDLPAYAAAIAESAIPGGGVAIDVGCGTGRALPALRDAVGPTGTVLGIDLTPQMLDVARPRADATHAGLILADARRLPLPDAAVDAVFAAGLITHLPDAADGLRELARVTRPGGRLVLFHPSGRAALAARHGRALRPDEPLSETRLRLAMQATGWRLTSYDDPPHRFLATATRQ
ncbi:class I SAM-dependent methyltransferase [Rhizomonospora bruguierae]|uniref:class I SAM-dependent methyltransferase n=1 Tax=Rhizomonospora bruguierae TaxID=1581705 RepID=UPI0020C02333|nr:methyltransferase domain-containing protein [Micromonospora sp. NBRC 107566]